MKKKKIVVVRMSTVGRITKHCRSTWGNGERHPSNAPCHNEGEKGVAIVDGELVTMYRYWVCHCETPLCQFVDYHEVRTFKKMIYDDE